jgi:hypothetical protein
MVSPGQDAQAHRLCALLRPLRLPPLRLNSPLTSLQKPLRQSILAPEYLISDFAKWDRPATLHVGFQALSAFRAAHSRLPAPRDEKDAATLVALATDIAAAAKLEGDLDTKVLSELSYQATGDLSPINAVMGGFVAQEVLKACSGKFGPLYQHLYFDALEALPDIKPSASDCAPSSPPSRHDGQIAVFGRAFQTKIENQRQFLVGAGAIGCEMLKNWAMMGLGTGEQGKIYVTDLDTIEKSNLNRQFLFRPRDVGSFKSEAGRRAVTEMNQKLEGKVEVFKLAVGGETEGEWKLCSRTMTDRATLTPRSSPRCVRRRLFRRHRRSHQRSRQRYGSCVASSAVLGSRSRISLDVPLQGNTWISDASTTRSRSSSRARSEPRPTSRSSSLISPSPTLRRRIRQRRVTPVARSRTSPT